MTAPEMGFGNLFPTCSQKPEHGSAPVTHVSEAVHLFPWMHWGQEHSAGHYLDLCSAILGLTLFPIGYLLHALAERHA
jgi:hypothetical protein